MASSQYPVVVAMCSNFNSPLLLTHDPTWVVLWQLEVTVFTTTCILSPSASLVEIWFWQTRNDIFQYRFGADSTTQSQILPTASNMVNRCSLLVTALRRNCLWYLTTDRYLCVVVKMISDWPLQCFTFVHIDSPGDPDDTWPKLTYRASVT